MATVKRFLEDAMNGLEIIGEQLAPILSNIVDWLTEALDEVNWDALLLMAFAIVILMGWWV